MDETALVVLFFEPTVVPVTVTLKVHEVFAASDPPEKEIVLGAVVVSEPPQIAVGPLFAIVRPAGKTSLKLIPLSELNKLRLSIESVNVEVWPTRIDAGEKDFSRSGGAITVKESVA